MNSFADYTHPLSLSISLIPSQLTFFCAKSGKWDFKLPLEASFNSASANISGTYCYPLALEVKTAESNSIH